MGRYSPGSFYMIYVLKSESDFTKYEREYNYYDQKKQQEGMRVPNISV